MADNIMGKTPAHAQEQALNPGNFQEAKAPPPQDWNQKPDPANDPKLALKGTSPSTENLWPNEAAQPKRLSREEVHARKRSSIAIGDPRLAEYRTEMKSAHAKPGSDEQTGLNRGLHSGATRNLAATKTAPKDRLSEQDPETRAFRYKRSLERVQNSAFPVEKLEENLVQRLLGKVRIDSNNNAFHLRRMFREFDPDNTGYVELEDFMAGCLDKGIQFTEEEFIALFARYDQENEGRVPYNRLASAILDRDLYTLSFTGTVGFDSKGTFTRKDQRDAFFSTRSKGEEGFTVEMLASGISPSQ